MSAGRKGENILAIIKKIEEVANMTEAMENLVITPGYYECFRNYSVRWFEPSDDPEKITAVNLHWKDQDLQFGNTQPIDGDSGYGVILDIVKAMRRMA